MFLSLRFIQRGVSDSEQQKVRQPLVLIDTGPVRNFSPFMLFEDQPLYGVTGKEDIFSLDITSGSKFEEEEEAESKVPVPAASSASLMKLVGSMTVDDWNSRWRDLPADILSLVADRLPAGDVVRFRGVCSPWRRAVSPRLQPPFLLSRIGGHEELDGDCFRLFDPSGRKDFYEISLPLLRNCYLAGSSADGSMLIFFDNLANLHLLDPLAASCIDLPSITIFPDISDPHPRGLLSSYWYTGMLFPVRARVTDLVDFYFSEVIVYQTPPASSSPAPSSNSLPFAGRAATTPGPSSSCPSKILLPLCCLRTNCFMVSLLVGIFSIYISLAMTILN